MCFECRREMRLSRKPPWQAGYLRKAPEADASRIAQSLAAGAFGECDEEDAADAVTGQQIAGEASTEGLLSAIVQDDAAQELQPVDDRQTGARQGEEEMRTITENLTHGSTKRALEEAGIVDDAGELQTSRPRLPRSPPPPD